MADLIAVRNALAAKITAQTGLQFMAPEVPEPWFTADRYGTCKGCGDGIMPGDVIRADSDGHLCGDCGR